MESKTNGFEKLEVGKIFMYSGKEYKITLINSKKERITLEPNGKEILPEINERIIIENIIFKVKYINQGKKRITIE